MVLNWYESFFLGILQGLTEFLPVSSSGHLVLAGKIFEIPNNLTFNVFLHIGTLASVCLIMFKQIIALFAKENRKKLLLLIIASVPTFILAIIAKLLLEESIMELFIPVGFALTIVLLTLSQFCAKEKFGLAEKNYPAIVTGVVQGLAVLPGLSRSGSTVSALTLMGVKREEAFDFSFLLSIPVILGSAAVETLGLIRDGAIPNIEWYCVIIGIISSFAVGCGALILFRRIIVRNKTIYFAIYLLIPLVLSIIFIWF